MSGRLNASLEQGLRGEYLVKSALNLARILVQADTTDEDSAKDPWAVFKSGQTIPLNMLGIDEPNVKVDLEISPLGAKIPLGCLITTSAGNPPPPYWLNVFKRLFANQGFDNDGEPDQTGRFEDRVFNSSELVANLVDFMDADSESLETPGFQGIESDLPAGVFRNSKILKETELASIPGFTPARLQRILRFISASSKCQINLNSVPGDVLVSLHPEISEKEIENIKAFRSGETGPFKQSSELQQYISQAAYTELDQNRVFETRGSRFIVIAKAAFLANVTFIKAEIDTQRSKDSLPKITYMELY